MIEEEYNKFCAEILNKFQNNAERLSQRERPFKYDFFYAYIKLPNGKKVLFYNQNGKYIFRKKGTLISQINDELFYDGGLTWNDSLKEKKRFIEENVEIAEINLPFYENY